MNLSCNKSITSGAGETLTITCFTCGMPSSKEWAQKVRSRPSSTHLKPYYPFLLQIHTSPGSALKDDGTTFVCAFCHASMEAQWKNYERQPTGIPPMNRKYNLYKFICAVCGIETYRKRVRTLPFQEFPFLTNQRPVGSLTLGNNPLAIVCLDCSETLWAQSAEYDRWGLPVHKRMFNWMARPPPPEDSVEATVARLPSGETQLPRCPPTEPVLVPKHKEHLPSTYDTLATKKAATKTRNSVSESSSSGNEPLVVRKTSLTSTTNPVLDAGVHPQSSQPPIVTVAPMSAHTTTLSALRKESMSVPPTLNSGVYPKYDTVSVSAAASGLQASQVTHPLPHPHPSTYFPRSPLFSSTYGHHGHSFSWSGDAVSGGREVGGGRSLGEHYAYSSAAAAAAAAAADLQASGNPSWPWMPPPPSSSVLQYPNYVPSFSSRSYNLNEQFYSSSHSFYPPRSPESNANPNPNLSISVVTSGIAGSSTTYAGPFGVRITSSSGVSGRTSSPIPSYPPSAPVPAPTNQNQSHSHSSSQCQTQSHCQKGNMSNSGSGQEQTCGNSDDPDVPLNISASKSLPVSTSSISSDYNGRRYRPVHEVGLGQSIDSHQQSSSSLTLPSGKRKSVGDGRKSSHKIVAHSESADDVSVIAYRGAAMPKKLLSSKTNHYHHSLIGDPTTEAITGESAYPGVDTALSSSKESSVSGSTVYGNDAFPTNFKPKSNAIRNHMKEKSLIKNQSQCQTASSSALGKQSSTPLSATKGGVFTSSPTVAQNPVTITASVPKKWQWQSQCFNNSRTTTDMGTTSTTSVIVPSSSGSGSSSNGSNSNSSGGSDRRGRSASESEPVDFSIVNRKSSVHSLFMDTDSTLKEVAKKSSDDEHEPEEAADIVMDLSLSSSNRCRDVYPSGVHETVTNATTNHTNNRRKSAETVPVSTPKLSKKFMIAYLCQSETSSDSPPLSLDNGQGPEVSVKPSKRMKELEIARDDMDRIAGDLETTSTVEDVGRSRQSSRSNISEPSGRRSVIITTATPLPLNSSMDELDARQKPQPKRRKRQNHNQSQRQRQLQRQAQRRANQSGKDKSSDKYLHVEVEDEEADDGDGSASSDRLDLDTNDDNDDDCDNDDDHDHDSPDRVSSCSLSLSLKKRQFYERKRKRSNQASQNRSQIQFGVEHENDRNVGTKEYTIVEVNVNKNDTSENGEIKYLDTVTATGTEICESDALSIQSLTKNVNAKTIMDHKRAQEYAKQVIGEYKLEERQTRILKRKLEVDQEEFLGSLGLITLQKKSELELNILIKRSNHYTLPPLKFRPSTPPKVQLSEEFEKKLLQIAFDDPSLNKKSDLSSDEVTFLAQLDLKPASIPEKNKREKEWRIILTERMMREKRGSYLRGAKKPWDSYCGASKLLTPTIKSPCDNYLDFFGSLSVTLPTEKNDFAFSNQNRTNGSSDLLTIVDNCSKYPNEATKATVASSESRNCSLNRDCNQAQPESITVSAMCIMQPVISYPKYIPSYVTQASVPTFSIQTCASTSDIIATDSNSANALAAAADALLSDSGRTSSHSPSSGSESRRGSLGEVHALELEHRTTTLSNSSPISCSKILKVPVISACNSGSNVPTPTTPTILPCDTPFSGTQIQTQPESDKKTNVEVVDSSSQSQIENKVAANNVVIKHEDGSSTEIRNMNSNYTTSSNNSRSQPTSMLDAIIDADIASCAKFEAEIQNLLNFAPQPPKTKAVLQTPSVKNQSEENHSLWPESVTEWKKLKKYLKTRQGQVKAIEDKLKKREKQILNQLRTCTKNTH